MLTQAPKGTRDMLPQDAYLWQWIESKEREAAARAGYREVRTPVFEHTELFLRGVGDTTDIVQKEMYTFKDKGDRSITLKPEGTAGAVRAFIENHLFSEMLPCKMYYLNAPIFRYENPQSGRLREHHQFGMECFGGKEPTVEAELISTLMGFLGSLGLKNLSVHINSIGCPECRPKYHEALKNYLGDRIHAMCETCQARFEKNPLRILDCKEEKCKAIVKGAPHEAAAQAFIDFQLSNEGQSIYANLTTRAVNSTLPLGNEFMKPFSEINVAFEDIPFCAEHKTEWQARYAEIRDKR